MTARSWPSSQSPQFAIEEKAIELPEISADEDLAVMMEMLARHIIRIIDVPHTFEELRTAAFGFVLTPLIDHLLLHVHHFELCSALLALRGYFAALDEDDDRHVHLTRAYACEIVAWRFAAHLSERDAIDYLLYEETPPKTLLETGARFRDHATPSHRDGVQAELPTERTRLVSRASKKQQRPTLSIRDSESSMDSTDFQTLALSVQNLNALEIAAVTGAKKFLMQSAVQRVIDGIWKGDIIFWESLSVHTVKKAQLRKKKRVDPFARLRVPLYLKIFEVLFFIVFLGLYYSVLIQRNHHGITAREILLLVWIAAFAVDEIGQYIDAGLRLYAVDFWSLWDIGIVVIGIAFFITRVIGLIKHNNNITEMSFDILALEALFLVPRIFSLMSLNPFFGMLIPCLKELTIYSTQFLGFVLVVYLGFLTTFTLLARDFYSSRQMGWMLVKIFFGSSYVGFDITDKISPVLGAPLMLVFVWLTNILLITTLISILSNRLSEVMAHAREEYLYVYSIFVLEASTSNRLTYYLPPWNLIPLLFRPLRIFVSAQALRTTRVIVLKVTHFPYVAAIWLYEHGRASLLGSTAMRSDGQLTVGRPPSYIGPSRQALFTLRGSTSPVFARPLAARNHVSLDGHSGTPFSKLDGRRQPIISARDPDVTGASTDVMKAQIHSLNAKVDGLTSKLDELVTMLSRQQNLRDEL